MALLKFCMIGVTLIFICNALNNFTAGEIFSLIVVAILAIITIITAKKLEGK